MRSPKWLTVEKVILLGLVLGFVLFVGLANVAAPWNGRHVEEARKSKAQLDCINLAKAIENYRTSAANKNAELPGTLNDLHQLPWGGPSLLTDGEASLI